MKYYIILIVILFSLSSCEEYENSAVPSKPTYLPFIEVNGESNIELACDMEGEYEDEGGSAFIGGEPTELVTKVKGTYFESTTVSGPDVYNVSYSAMNTDSISSVKSRTVFWPACNGDLVNSITGVYKMSVERNGTIEPKYENNGPFIIIDLGGNEYYLSDVMGGYYEHGRGYGSKYITPMKVTANDISTNDFSAEATNDKGWGDEMKLTSMSVDAASKTITVETHWNVGEDGFIFVTTLTQCDDGVKCWE